MATQTTKLIKGQDAYFTVHWSPLIKADRHEISAKVPSVPGIFELFYKDDHKVLHLFSARLCWYGGLRHSLREHIDPEVERDPELRPIVTRYEIWQRYTEIPTFPDLQDVYFFLMNAGFGKKVEHSKRYKMIYLREIIPEA